MNKLLSLSLIIMAFTACDMNSTNPGDEQELTSEADSSMIKARLNFENYCSGCHGEQMQAFVDRKWKFGNTEDSLRLSITNGHPEEGMPSFKDVLSEEEINGLVAYILSGIANVDEYVFQKDELKSDTFKTEEFTFHLDTIMSGIESPWGMAFLPNDELLVTEKSGKLYRVKKDRSKIEVSGVPAVRDQGQGGLLDIALHPDFRNNQLLYISFSNPKDKDGETTSATVVRRYKLSGNRLTEEQQIFEAVPYSTKTLHYGSRMQFDRDGYLFLSVGDRGSRDENPQDIKVFPGKVHRINDDGSIPDDNPFVDEEGAAKSIYSYGHRNPQGMALNPETGDLWTHEHGPRGGDEINIIEKGSNYGWPVISYGLNYDGTIFTDKTKQEDMKQPVMYWTPSIAPSGMDFVKGDRYPGWEGKLLSGSLRYKYVNVGSTNNDKVESEEKVMKNIGRVRNVRMGPDGYIYVAVERPGFIFKLIPLND